jgi:hypothetical protein
MLNPYASSCNGVGRSGPSLFVRSRPDDQKEHAMSAIPPIDPTANSQAEAALPEALLEPDEESTPRDIDEDLAKRDIEQRPDDQE